MSYKIRITRRAEKEIAKVPKTQLPHILDKIESIAKDPYQDGVKKIQASKENLFRVRQGNYRVVYLIAVEVKIVEVRRVAHRKDAY